jgi:hypothetical protein
MQHSLSTLWTYARGEQVIPHQPPHVLHSPDVQDIFREWGALSDDKDPDTLHFLIICQAASLFNLNPAGMDNYEPLLPMVRRAVPMVSSEGLDPEDLL